MADTMSRGPRSLIMNPSLLPPVRAERSPNGHPFLISTTSRTTALIIWTTGTAGDAVADVSSRAAAQPPPAAVTAVG